MLISATSSKVEHKPALKLTLNPSDTVSPSIEVTRAGPETAFVTSIPLKRIPRLFIVLAVIFPISNIPCTIAGKNEYVLDWTFSYVELSPIIPRIPLP